MSKVFDLIRKNYIAIGIAALLYVIYLQFTYAGNRICDCETTEKYSPGTTSSSSYYYRGGVNRFYHK